MLTLILGGSGSGKSEYAENLLMSRGQGPLLYVATMWFDSGDPECVKRILRHRKMRANKGFDTVECPLNLDRAEIAPGSRVLLECMSNLTANEMFLSQPQTSAAVTADRICRGLERLVKLCPEVCVVSNDIFGDGITYDEGTMAYLDALGRINRWLAARADEVTEVVYSIPVSVKSKKDKNQ